MIQISIQQDTETLKMRYMIFKDLENVFNVAAQFNAVLDSCELADPLINIFYNRLLLQLNISNLVHLDLQERTQGNQLKFCKQQVNQIAQKMLNQIGNQKLKELLNNYIDNLESAVQFKKLELIKIDQMHSFSKEISQTLIANISQNDKIMESISKQGEKPIEINSDQLFQNYQLQYQLGVRILQNK